MESKYRKLKKLTNIIRGVQPLGVFTLIDKQWYHKGKPVSQDQKQTIAKGYERTIDIHPKPMA